VPVDANEIRGELEESAYDDAGFDLVRFRSDAHDERLRALIEDLAALPADERRAALPFGELADQVVHCYAERRTLASLRDHGLGEALEGWLARLVRPAHEFERWRHDLLYTGFVARRAGALDDSLMSVAARVGPDELVRHVADVVSNLDRIADLDDVGKVTVTTRYGLGVLNVEITHSDRMRGLGRAPSLIKSNLMRFEPKDNLADVAAAVADSLESSHQVVVGTMTVTALPDTALAGLGDVIDEHCTACVSMVAYDADGGADGFACYVAELDDDEVTEAVIEAVNELSDAELPLRAVGQGTFAVVLVATPSFDEDEVSVDLAEFDGAITGALGEFAG
jgi:hypothetical protein